MSSLRQISYDLFSKVYDLVIRLHSRDLEGSLRRYVTKKANLSKGDRALDPGTRTGSVAVKMFQGNASQLPFKSSSYHGVTCSHAFYELKGAKRMMTIEEVARVFKEGERFCLMEHTIPNKFITRFFFNI